MRRAGCRKLIGSQCIFNILGTAVIGRGRIVLPRAAEQIGHAGVEAVPSIDRRRVGSQTEIVIETVPGRKHPVHPARCPLRRYPGTADRRRYCWGPCPKRFANWRASSAVVAPQRPTLAAPLVGNRSLRSLTKPAWPPVATLISVPVLAVTMLFFSVPVPVPVKRTAVPTGCTIVLPDDGWRSVGNVNTNVRVAVDQVAPNLRYKRDKTRIDDDARRIRVDLIVANFGRGCRNVDAHIGVGIYPVVPYGSPTAGDAHAGEIMVDEIVTDGQAGVIRCAA